MEKLGVNSNEQRKVWGLCQADLDLSQNPLLVIKIGSFHLINPDLKSSVNWNDKTCQGWEKKDWSE